MGVPGGISAAESPNPAPLQEKGARVTTSHHTPDPDPGPYPALLPLPFATPWEYELHFPRDPRGPGIARATIRSVLLAHGLDELRDRAELLTSELATNAVRYSRGPATVRLRWANPVLRVSITDTCPDFPDRGAAAEPWDAERGRGLLILDLFADAWGGCRLDRGLFGPGGKSIWFDLTFGDTEPPPVPAVMAA